MTGLSASAVGHARRKRGISAANESFTPPIPWNELPLGQKPDAEIAREIGCSGPTVSKARKRLGIPAFGVAATRKTGKKGTDWDEQPLGQMPDAELARRLGVDHTTVTGARRRRGIKAYKMPKQTWLDRAYRDLKFKWDDIEAVEARLRELKRR
jgi:hypothetical protein